MTRCEYVLTDRGAGLFPVFVALMEWGDAMDDDGRTALDLEHAGCGGRLHAEVRCDEGHVVRADEGAARLRDEAWRSSPAWSSDASPAAVVVPRFQEGRGQPG